MADPNTGDNPLDANHIWCSAIWNTILGLILSKCLIGLSQKMYEVDCCLADVDSLERVDKLTTFIFMG